MAESPRTSLSDHEFSHLVVRYLDGQISPEELSQLNAELATDDSKRELFVDLCLQGRLMAESLGGRLAMPDTEPRRRSPLLGFLADSFRQGAGIFSNPTRFSILIAATAMSLDVPLAAKNRLDFRFVEGLELAPIRRVVFTCCASPVDESVPEPSGIRVALGSGDPPRRSLRSRTKNKKRRPGLLSWRWCR